MGVSYPLTLPAGISNVTFEAVNAITINRNPFSLQAWLQDWGGCKWQVVGETGILNSTSVHEWRGFFSSLASGKGNFLIGDPYYPGPQGIISVTAAINGNNQYGTTISVRNFIANQTGCVKRGDYFSIGNRLYVVLQDANANGSGIASLDIFPSLRDGVPDGTALVWANPKGVFRLLDYRLNQQQQGFYQVNFSGEEDI